MKTISGLRKADNKTLLKMLLATPGLRFLYPLWEGSGTTAVDMSGNGLNGVHDGVTLAQPGVNARVPLMTSFDGVNDRTLTTNDHSVKGLSQVSLMCIASITSAGERRQLWSELVDDSDRIFRFALEIAADNKLNSFYRTSDLFQSSSTVTSDSSMALATYMIHLTLDVAAENGDFYINGTVLSTSKDISFDGDTTMANTNPYDLPRFGHAYDSAGRWYDGEAAFVAQWSRALTSAEILSHARAGGFA